MVRSKASMWRWRDGSSIRLGCSNRQRQYSRTPAGGNMADGWTCPYASKRHPTFEPAENKDGNGYMARSLSRWWDGKQARQSMLHASLAPPPQPRQRGRRIYLLVSSEPLQILVFFCCCVCLNFCSPCFDGSKGKGPTAISSQEKTTKGGSISVPRRLCSGCPAVEFPTADAQQ